jgi:hypothetical protein
MYNKYEHNKTVVSAQAYNNKVTVELPIDANLNDLMDAFRTLVIGLTYSPDSWEHVIMQLADEYREIEEMRSRKSDFKWDFYMKEKDTLPDDLI